MPPTQPNLIVILAHGLRFDLLGHRRGPGHWPLHTPFLTKLAREGVAVPMVTASPAEGAGMTSLITGLHARQHGLVDPTRCAMPGDGWPLRLVEAGYQLYGVGQVAMIEPWLTEAQRVDGLESTNASHCAYLRSLSQSHLLEGVIEQRRQRLRHGPFQPTRVLLDPDEDVDGYIALQARLRLEQMPADRPWCLVVAFTGPGNDLPPPPMYERVVEASLCRGSFVPVGMAALDDLVDPAYPRSNLQRLDEQKLARIRADYLNRVSLFDHGVGRLMQAWQRRVDRERTWVAMAGDDGYLLGEHGLVGRRSLLRGSIEVPLVLRGPRMLGSVELPAVPVSSVDAAATLCELAGIDPPRGCTGASLLDLLRGGDRFHDNRRVALSELGRRLMLQSRTHKAVFDTATGQVLRLIDLANDPMEQRNLVSTVEGMRVMDAMRWRLADALLPLRSAAW